MLLLAALLARADDPRLARWEVVEPKPVVEPDGSEGLYVPWQDGSTLALRCPGQDTPPVVGVSRGVRIQGELVSPAAAADAWQVVPPSGVRWSGFLIQDPACTVQRRRVRATPWSWALAEHDGSVDEDRALLVGEAAAEWAGVDALRQAALRPPGPHPTGFRRLWGDRDKVTVGARDWVRLPVDQDIRFTGPRRLRLDVRALGLDPPESCILLDGSLLCQPSSPTRTVQVVDGALRYGPRTLPDGTPVHGIRTWQIAVGEGEHRLRMDRDMLVRASLHRVETYGGARPRAADLKASEGVAVWAPAEDVSWETAPSDGGEGTWIGREGRPGTTDAVAWHPVADRLPDVEPVESGELALWIEPEGPDVPCHLHLGETHFVALGPAGVHRFEWVGPSPRVLPELSARGCQAYLHGAGPVTPGAKSLVYLNRIDEGEPFFVTTDPARPARLEVAIEQGIPWLQVTATSVHGVQVRWRLDAREEAAGRVDEHGLAWTDPVRLPLPGGAEGWEITVDDVAMVRVRQPALEGEAVVDVRDPEGPAPDALGPGDEARVGEVRWPVGEHGEALFDPEDPPDDDAVLAITRRLPRAADDRERAALLVERGGLLAARGAEALGARDLLRAEELDPEQAGLSSPVGRALRLARERALFGAERWRAEDHAWIRVEGELDAADRTRAQAAARGDYLGVATRMQGAEAARWWRRALLGGQIPTAPQRLQAYLLSAELPDHPGLHVLMTGTRWDGVHLVRGAGRRKTVPWPLQRDPDEDLLYPDPWPVDRIVPLRRGWLLRLPPRAEGQAVHVRCLVRALGTRGPCRVLVEDAGGDELTSTLISGWGTPEAIWLPPGPAAYLRLDEPWGARAQLLWTQPGEVPGLERLAWEARPGEPLTTTVLGPTAVRAHVRPLGTEPVDVRMAAGGVVVTQRVVDEGEVVLPALDEGPVQVSISVSRGAWVRVATRRAARGGPVPTGDRRAVARAQLRPPPTPASARTAAPLPPPQPALAAGDPPHTWFGELIVGSAEWTPAESRGPTGAPPAISLTGGLQSHFHDRAWVEGSATVQSRIDGTNYLTLNGGGDWRLTQGRTRVYGIGDLRLATGPFADRAVLFAGHADLGLRLVHPVWPGGTVQGRLRVRGHVRSPLDPDQGYEPNRTRLWSRYVEDHPARLGAAVTLRHRAGPWIVVRGGVRAYSNAPNDPLPIDLLGFDTSVDLSRAAWFTRLGTGLEVRFLDAFRKEQFTSVYFDGRVQHYGWVTERIGLQPWAGLRWRPTDRKLSAMVGVEARFGSPRGLVDVRPSRLASRHVGEWGFWKRAHERWPVSGGAESDPDWSPPPPDPVEVAP